LTLQATDILDAYSPLAQKAAGTVFVEQTNLTCRSALDGLRFVARLILHAGKEDNGTSSSYS